MLRRLSRSLPSAFASLLKLSVGLSALAVALASGVRPAAEVLDDAEVARFIGVGPQVSARMERAAAHLAAGDVAEAAATADSLLVELANLNRDPENTLGTTLIGELALQAVVIRNAALLASGPFPDGFRGAFLNSAVNGATLTDWSLGVPASVTLAQAILESDWGRSAPGNNLFGMKGEGPAGAVKRRVVEYRHGVRRIRTASFRLYNAPEESIADHARVLAESPRYAAARKVAEDASAYARALQGTYATDPRYAKKLAAIADHYALQRFDWHTAPPLEEGGIADAEPGTSVEAPGN